MAGLRRDVSSLGPGWNKTLLNYALAMRALDALPIADRNSWKFLAAIHGIDPAGWVQNDILQPGTAIPADLTNRTYGNQCQHGSWYFLPWHRAYLAAFEAIVAAKVKELTGDDWALPYWNYLDATNADARRIPEAFIAQSLPDGSPNPLRKYLRRPGITRLPPALPSEFSLDAMEEDDFIIDGGLGFGGGITGDFVQFFGRKGGLEQNPHDTVHGMISGVMGNARYAGLDPIFWLHHCNIDRLWEAWMSTSGKTMVKDPRWLEGPADRTFIMPAVGGGDGIEFSARDTLKGGALYPTYDDLTKGTGVTPGGPLLARIGMGPADEQTVEVIGASPAVVTVGQEAVAAPVDLEPQAAAASVAAMGETRAGEEVSRLYLALEAIRGAAPSPVLDVFVNLPDGAGPQEGDDRRAGRITLFGLDVASEPDGEHGGNGLGYTLDITDLATRLEASGDLDPEKLRVTLAPVEGITDDMPVTVERIAVLKRTGVVS